MSDMRVSIYRRDRGEIIRAYPVLVNYWREADRCKGTEKVESPLNPGPPLLGTPASRGRIITTDKEGSGIGSDVYRNSR